MDEVMQNQKVDEVLNSVSDQYLKKKKRNKKIIFSVVSVFVLLLSIVIIILSCVKINLKPYFLTEPASIHVYIDGSRKYLTTPTDEDYDEFNQIYQEAFNSNILTALFTGKLGSYQINEPDKSEDFYANQSSLTGMSGVLLKYLGENYVHLEYVQDQQMYNADGSVYYSRRNNLRYNMQYQDVYFNISDTNVDHELTFYFGAYYKDDDGVHSPHIITITIRANTYQLYDYVANI